MLADAGAAGKTGPPQPFSRLQEKGWLRYSAPILLIGATLLPPPVLHPQPPPGWSLDRPPSAPHSPRDDPRPEGCLFALFTPHQTFLVRVWGFVPLAVDRQSITVNTHN